MTNPTRRPQRKKTFRHTAGYHRILIRDRLGRMVHKWTRRIPLASPTTPAPGTAPERSPLWPPFLLGYERAQLRKDLAHQAASIFLAEAHRIGTLDREKGITDVLSDDLERLADEQEAFLIDEVEMWHVSVAEAQMGYDTDVRYHGDYTWLVAYGGERWALSRMGGDGYWDHPEPDRTRLTAAAQRHSFVMPFVDGNGNVRLFHEGDEPPTDRADVLPIHIAGTTQ